MKPGDVVLWAGLPVFNTLNQMAMKLTAGVMKEQPFGISWLLDALQCKYIWMSMGCEMVNFALWLMILKSHALSRAFPMTAISYAAMLLVSWGFFHERLQLQQIAGTIIIVIGVAMLAKEKAA